MTTSKARQYYVSEETRKTLSDIGGGNYSRGIRVAALNNRRLLEALESATKKLEAISHHHNNPFVADEAKTARALLTEIEEGIDEKQA